MKVFKYLVALADISVGFLGLFFIIFAVTRPSAMESQHQKTQLTKEIRSLEQQLRELERIHLAKSRSGKNLENRNAARLTLTTESVRFEHQGRRLEFRTMREFEAAASRLSWPDQITLYVDHRLPFEQVVRVIDVLKQAQNEITVQIAALAQ